METGTHKPLLSQCCVLCDIRLFEELGLSRVH